MALTQDEIDELARKKQQEEQDNYQAARPNLSGSSSEQQEEEKPKFDRAAKYAGLFSDLENKQAPGYNTRFEKQQKSLMTAQTIGNALSLVGDVAGAAMGAPVKRRQFKSTEPYLQAIEDKRLQYEKDTEAFNDKKYAEQLRLMGYMKQEEGIKAQAEQNVIANARADAGLDIQKQNLALRQAGDVRAQADQEASAKLDQAKFKEDQRQFDETQKFNKEKLTAENMAEMLANVQKDEKGNLKLFTNTGEEVASLDASKVNKAFAMIQEDYGDSPELQKDITLLKAQFGEGLSKDARAFLVAKHWNNSGKAKKFLKLGESEQQKPIDQSNRPSFWGGQQAEPAKEGVSMWDKLVNMG